MDFKTVFSTSAYFFVIIKEQSNLFKKGAEIKKPGKLEVLPGFNAVGEGLEPSRGS